MRLIDADELLKRVEQSWQNAGLHSVDYRKFKKWVHSMPTIEAVPLEAYRSMEQTVHKLTQAIAEAEPRWIPCSERLPEDGKYVLAYSADDDFMIVEAKHKFEAFQITHWMPLPKPYKADEVKK